MKHIKTIQQPCINASAHTGCGECQVRLQDLLHGRKSEVPEGEQIRRFRLCWAINT